MLSLRLFASVLFLHAANLLSAQAPVMSPALALHATQYNTGIETLRAAWKATLAEHEARYAQQLDVAIKAAAEPLAGTLKRERDGVVAGLLAPANPEGLPVEVATARKAFFAGAGKAAFDFQTEKKKLDEAYLKALGVLAKEAKGKQAAPELAAQVAAEKRRVTKKD